MVLVVPVVRSASADRPVIHSRWADTAPSINGVFETGEWSGPQIVFQTPTYPDTYVLPTYAYFVNDHSNLYVMVDAVGDTTETTGDECAFVLNFDLGTRVTVFVTAGGGTGPTGATATVGFGNSPNSATPHRIYEFSIPLTLISATPGQSIDFSSPNVSFKPSMPYDPGSQPPRDNVWPLNLDFSNQDAWGTLSLSSGAPVGGVLEPLNKTAILTPYLSLITLLGTMAVAMTVKKRRI
jgi:predicted nucleic acid-binding Zn ribbon protein